MSRFSFVETILIALQPIFGSFPRDEIVHACQDTGVQEEIPSSAYAVGVHGGQGGAKTNGESAGRRGLDLDLDHLPRAQGNVREELG
jgi:hypothetical protein